MEFSRIVRYIIAADEYEDGMRREAAVHAAHGSDPDTATPLDSGPGAALEIYGIRAVTITRHTGVMALRLTGLDAVYRVITNTDFPA